MEMENTFANSEYSIILATASSSLVAPDFYLNARVGMVWLRIIGLALAYQKIEIDYIVRWPMKSSGLYVQQHSIIRHRLALYPGYYH